MFMVHFQKGANYRYKLPPPNENGAELLSMIVRSYTCSAMCLE